MEKLRPRLRPIAAALCAVVVLSACSRPAVVHLSTAPAEKLRLGLVFTQALAPSAQVIVDVTLSTAPGNQIQLADNQHLTVNGQTVDASSSVPLDCCGYRFTVPRPPAGGKYTAVYTDERGQQTTVVVPAPQRDLTITSPTAHAQIAIPNPGGQVAVQYTVPSLFPSISPLSRFPSTQIHAGAEGHCRVATSPGIVASAPSCINVGSAQPDETGSAVISDTHALPGDGFGNLAPGPGDLYVGVNVHGNLPPAGFASVLISFTDTVYIPITWV
ncbi:MAG TPA: hypothetical protein VF510_07955 [Ktedonobacterales bacterium]